MSETTRDLVILGAGGHAREILACLRNAAGAHGLAQRLLGFLDDDPQLQESEVAGVQVLGGLDFPLPRMTAILGVGYPQPKLKIWRRMSSRVNEWPSLLASSAAIGERVQIGAGVFIQQACVLTTDIEIGDLATINVAATISHDCRVGRLATVSPGAHVGGNVTIGEGAFIGIGANVSQGVTIGAWSVVGAGAVVVESVPPNAVAVGVPARVIEVRRSGWQDE